VLGNLGAARAVNRSPDRLDDQIRSSRVDHGIAELVDERVTRQHGVDVGGVGAGFVRLEHLDGRRGLALILPPDQGDVVVGALGDPDAGVGQQGVLGVADLGQFRGVDQGLAVLGADDDLGRLEQSSGYAEFVTLS
jgi:hypothetical protein